MRTNADCTIYNKVNTGTVNPEYKRTELYGVFWDNRKGRNVINSGMVNADSVAVYIPTLVTSSKTYKKPKEWDALSAGDKLLYWTIKPGDKLVRGIVTYEIPNGTVAILEKTYDDVVTITSVDNNDGGSISLQHWRVGGA